MVAKFIWQYLAVWKSWSSVQLGWFLKSISQIRLCSLVNKLCRILNPTHQFLENPANIKQLGKNYTRDKLLTSQGRVTFSAGWNTEKSCLSPEPIVRQNPFSHCCRLSFFSYHQDIKSLSWVLALVNCVVFFYETLFPRHTSLWKALKIFREAWRLNAFRWCHLKRIRKLSRRFTYPVWLSCFVDGKTFSVDW